MIDQDFVFTLPSGTEISLEAALGDLDRAAVALGELGLEDLQTDLFHVAELLSLFAARDDD